MFLVDVFHSRSLQISLRDRIEGRVEAMERGSRRLMNSFKGLKTCKLSNWEIVSQERMETIALK